MTTVPVIGNTNDPSTGNTTNYVQTSYGADVVMFASHYVYAPTQCSGNYIDIFSLNSGALIYDGVLDGRTSGYDLTQLSKDALGHVEEAYVVQVACSGGYAQGIYALPTTTEISTPDSVFGLGIIIFILATFTGTFFLSIFKNKHVK